MTRHLTLILCALLVLSGCSKKEEAEPKAVAEVKTDQAVVEDVEETISGPAALFPLQQSGAAARTAAPISQLLVKKGDTVKAGQTLAILEARDVVAAKDEAAAAVVEAEANLQKIVAGTLPSDLERARGQLTAAQAAYHQAEVIYERRKGLFKDGAIPQRDLLVSETEVATTKANYDVAKLAYDLLKKESNERDIQMAKSHLAQAKARLAGAEAQFSYTRITAPFAGTVTDQFMFAGDMARPDAPVFQISDLSKDVARAQIPESDAGPIQIGQSCRFIPGTTAAGEGEDAKPAPIQGKVISVNRAADQARRSIEVWCEIGMPPASLHPGTYGDVAIVTGKLRGVTVPREALQFNEGTRTGWVMAVDGKVVHKRDVQTGVVSAERVHIVKGLNAGETVVTEGVYGLADGGAITLASDKPKDEKDEKDGKKGGKDESEQGKEKDKK